MACLAKKPFSLTPCWVQAVKSLGKNADAKALFAWLAEEEER